MVVTTGGVRFDGQAPGTPEDAWARTGLPVEAPALDLTGIRRLLVVSAHPDDETLGAAGLLARLHAAGATVRVLVASDGEASHPRSPTTPPAVLGRRRRHEMTAATGHLAPGGRIDWLGLPDGRLARHEAELAAAVGRAVDGMVGGTVGGSVGGSVGGTVGGEVDRGPGTLVVSPWHADGHPDHEAVARAVAAGIAGCGTPSIHLEFPVWAWLWAGPDDPRLRPGGLRVLRLTAGEQRAKARAIAEHRSQIAPLGSGPGDEAVLTPDFLAHFRRSWEIYLPAGGAAA